MKKCFYTEKGPKAIGPYAPACTAGNTVYFSGMLGVNPEYCFLSARFFLVYRRIQ